MKIVIPILLLLCLSGFGQESNLAGFLRDLPGATVRELEGDSLFLERYEIMLAQPLDHDNPEAGMFSQRLILSHRDTNKPLVLVTEGYSLRKNYVRELAEMLQANQLRVEHRFFGQSKPDSLPWPFLNIRQSSSDYHRIYELFRRFYRQPWISTGWSKGGQTAICYRRFYPEDMAVTVAYDSPLNVALEEPRINQFFEEVSTAECRSRLRNLQQIALQNKPELLEMFREDAQQHDLKYSIGDEAAFEFIVLEYPFSFWQYHKIPCDSVPDETAPLKDVFRHLKRVVSFSSYSDYALNSASMYQFATELGYYGYVRYYLAPWLSGAYNYQNSIFAPQTADLTFQPEVMEDIRNWLWNHGHRMVYLYGSNDPWAAPAVQVNPELDALKIVLEGGNHYTFVRTLPENMQNLFRQYLQRWLNNSEN